MTIKDQGRPRRWWAYANSHSELFNPEHILRTSRIYSSTDNTQKSRTKTTNTAARMLFEPHQHNPRQQPNPDLQKKNAAIHSGLVSPGNTLSSSLIPTRNPKKIEKIDKQNIAVVRWALNATVFSENPRAHLLDSTSRPTLYYFTAP